ncbi:MAG: response regulator [Bdellovibrionota bacterium]
MDELKYNPEQLKVLIVDDHDPIRKAIKKIVQSMKAAEVVECFDGKDAIAKLANEHFDLILCDIYMRKTSGFDVLSYLRNRQIANDIPFIIITGEASKEDIVKSSDLGANDYILKPFQAENLEIKIKRVLNEFYSPSPAVALLRKGEKLLLEKKYSDSEQIILSALKLEKDNPKIKHLLAISKLLQGKEEESMAALRKNITDFPSYYKNYVTLANIYLKKGNIQETIAALVNELNLHPKQPKRQVLLAKLLMQEGDIDGAINHFREALRENAKYKPALMGMGHAFARKEDLEKSIYYFKRLRRHHPKETKALEAVVKYCLEADVAKKAEHILRDEKKNHPERLDVYPILAKLYVAMDQDDIGLQIINELFKIDQENINGLRIKGAIEFKLDNIESATETYKKLISLDSSESTHLGLAKCYQKQGNYKNSLAVLNKAIQLNPKNPKVLYMLGISLFKTKQFSKAFCILTQAKRLGYDKGHCDKNIAQCYRAIRVRHQSSRLIA